MPSITISITGSVLSKKKESWKQIQIKAFPFDWQKEIGKYLHKRHFYSFSFNIDYVYIRN